MTKYSALSRRRKRGQAKCRQAKRGQAKRGQAVVEMALIAPVLLMLLMLIIQYSLIMNAAATLTNLAREGARYAATQPTDTVGALNTAGITGRMQNVCPSSIKWSDVSGNITITCTDSSGNATTNYARPNLIAVAVTYDMRKKLFLPTKFFGVNVFSQNNYTAKTTMMIE